VQVVERGDEGPVGLAEPERGQRAEQQVEAVADLGLSCFVVSDGAWLRRIVDTRS
jgi:hypothetical protein